MVKITKHEETEYDPKTWKTCHDHGLTDHQNVTLVRAIYRFNMIPIKTPIIRFRKSVAKIHMETRDLKQLQQP